MLVLLQLDVNLAMKDGSTYVLDIELAGKIDPAKSVVAYRSVKAEIKLAKLAPQEWGALKAADGEWASARVYVCERRCARCVEWVCWVES